MSLLGGAGCLGSGPPPHSRSLLLQPLISLSSLLELAGGLCPPGGHPDYLGVSLLK